MSELHMMQSTYACKDCDSISNNAQEFYEHYCKSSKDLKNIKIWRQTAGVMYDCETCGKSFKERYYYATS